MHKVLESFIRQRRITIFAIVLVMILGVMNYINAPKQQSPRIQLATALITTIYPGGSAEDVERLVTREIEEKLMALDECDEVSSYSNPNHSVVFYSVKASDDYSEQWSTLRRAMKEVQSDLPEACNSITVDTDFMKTVGFILSIYSEDGMINTLESYSDSFENELEKVPGISRVDVIGKRDQEVIVELNHQKLNQLAIGYNDIVSIIRAQNIEIPSGHVEVGNEQIVFQVQGLYNQVEDIENIVVAVSDETGIMTRLKDIATIYIENKAEGTRILNNQRQSLLITGYFESGQNIIPIGQEINDIIDDISTRLPSNIVIEKIMFQPDQVNSEISKFMMSLLQGIVLVIIVVFIGLGIRNAFVVAVAIPLSILVTMTLMGLWSIEIQQISITALIIALGMLVDNAIVVSDAIQVRIDNGQKRLDACIEGALEVSRPVLTSTLTTICTFMPILLLGGEMGEYLRSMPIIVMVSLTASYFVAIFVTPVLAFIAFKPSINKRERKHRLAHLLEYAMRHRLRVILIVISLFIFSLFSVQWIGLKFFPYADTDMLYVDVNTEHVVSIDETEVLAKEVSRVLMETKGVKKIVSSVGDGMPRFFDTMFPAFPAIDYSQMLLIIDKEMIGPNKSYSSLTDLRDVLQKKLNESVIAGHLEVMQLEQGEPVGAPINVKVVGDGRDRLKEAGEYVEGLLKDIP